MPRDYIHNSSWVRRLELHSSDSEFVRPTGPKNLEPVYIPVPDELVLLVGPILVILTAMFLLRNVQTHVVNWTLLIYFIESPSQIRCR